MENDSAKAELSRLPRRAPEALPRAEEWLQKHGDEHPLAGWVFQKVLLAQCTDDMVARARNWIAQHELADAAPSAVGGLLYADPCDRWNELAAGYLKRWESLRGDNSDDAAEFRRSCSYLMMCIRFSAENPLLDNVDRLLERYPEDKVWHHVCWSTGAFKPSHEFTRRWISLNKSNPDLCYVGILTLVPSPPVLDAMLLWMRAHPDGVLDILVCEALHAAQTYHKGATAETLDIAREWLRRCNPEDGAGRVLAEILATTQHQEDMDAALDWYKGLPNAYRMDAKSASNDACAGFVLSAILDVCRKQVCAPPPYVIAEAKRILNATSTHSFMRLLYSLLATCRDDECVDLARKYLQHNADLRGPIEQALGMPLGEIPS